MNVFRAHPLATGEHLTGRHRAVVFLLTAMVMATTMLFWPAQAAAAPGCGADPAKWWNDPEHCLKTTPGTPLSTINAACLQAPTPDSPASGMGGWLNAEPSKTVRSGRVGLFTEYGYAGYDMEPYDVGCGATGDASALSAPGETTASAIGNMGMQFAEFLVGNANSLREKAWNPHGMWGWADQLVNTATDAIFQKVFSVFGGITLAVTGLYLLWRARSADMNRAFTIVLWAVFVMVVVTALARWPVTSAHLADNILTQGIGTVHSALTPSVGDGSSSFCGNGATTCVDHRDDAQRQADEVTYAILYRGWLRGELGDPDSAVAKKYGRALYDANGLSWDDYDTIKRDPSKAKTIVAQHQKQWNTIAAQIQQEDPTAYTYLQGKGWSRAATGWVTALTAIGFSYFDIASSLLVLLGFLIFRWAVVAAPAIGTFAMFEPASGALKRMANVVLAALFNVIVFGAAGAAYLMAENLILSTHSLPGWLQLVLIWMCGIVGWLMFRPYRRITQLGGKNPMAEAGNIGGWHKKLWGDVKQVALGSLGAYFGDTKALDAHDERQQARGARAQGGATTTNYFIFMGRPEDQPESGPTRVHADVFHNRSTGDLPAGREALGATAATVPPDTSQMPREPGSMGSGGTDGGQYAYDPDQGRGDSGNGRGPGPQDVIDLEQNEDGVYEPPADSGRRRGRHRGGRPEGQD